MILDMPSALLSIFALVIASLFGWTQWQTRRIEARFPPQGVRVETADGLIHMTRRDPMGDVRGTIVLLHGASGNQADLMGALGDKLTARGFRVFAVDRPGHGWSERNNSDDAASPARQAGIVRAALERAGVDRALVVGHSLAGAMTTNFALDHADFTRGIVLVAPVTHPWPKGVAWYYNLATTPVAGTLFRNLIALPAGMAMMDAAIASVFAPRVPPVDFMERTGATLVLRPAEFLANAQDVVALNPFLIVQAPRLPQIKIPVGIVTGDSDSVVLTKLHSYGSARDIPGATLSVLPGVGHSPHWSEPDAVISVIEQVHARMQNEGAQSARATAPVTPSNAAATSSQ